jgi:hypothetical protein
MHGESREADNPSDSEVRPWRYGIARCLPLRGRCGPSSHARLPHERGG